MLLTITTTHVPATDLGYLLHKNPAAAQVAELPFGRAHVLYPEANERRCTAALVLEVDAVGLVRGRSGATLGAQDYVGDRPYAASSFMSVAIARLFGTAMNGRSKERPELAASALPLQATVASVPCAGGPELVRSLFEPLGYAVALTPQPLDERFGWDESRYLALELRATCRLADLLSHLYVLLPVLDNDKHYWVEQAEIDKLLRRGEGWLAAHPARELIVARYLRYQRRLTTPALAQLSDPADETDEQREVGEEQAERPLRLNDLRLEAVRDVLVASGATRVADLGCGEGRLLRLLLAERQFQAVLGLDVSTQALGIAASRLKLDRLSELQRGRITLLQGSLTYRDERLAGYEAACAVEVIEHLDPWRLASFEHAMLGAYAPELFVLTTPNAEYNAHWETLPAGSRRHPDHRFEWTRAELAAWAERAAAEHGYALELGGIGPEVEGLGAPTQLAVFRR